MAKYDYDLFVVGAGSGGVRAARMSAAMGARVAIAEERYLGGTCVNVGCVPKKLLVYASHYRSGFEDAAGFGWSTTPPAFDWRRLIARKDAEIARLNGVYADLLRSAGVDLLTGRATLVDPHAVQIGAAVHTAAHILVATGAWPHVPDVPGHEQVITSNEAFHLEHLPRRVLIVGGGYIAVEFAGILHGLGCDVTQVYRGPLFLRGFDDDVRTFLAAQMRKQGIDLRFDAEVASIARGAAGISVALGGGTRVDTDLVFYATGRTPLTRGLGLEACGVELDARGAIVVDGNYCTSVPSIYALGDVTNRVNLTPVAIAEAMALAWHLFGERERRVEYEFIPSAVFSQPAVGTVGYTEAAARAAFTDVAIYKTSFTPLRHRLSGRDEQTLMKLVVDQTTGRVVGAHMVGEDAGETIQGIAIALKAGATKETFDRTIGIHPTAAEEFVTMREPAN